MGAGGSRSCVEMLSWAGGEHERHNLVPSAVGVELRLRDANFWSAKLLCLVVLGKISPAVVTCRRSRKVQEDRLTGGSFICKVSYRPISTLTPETTAAVLTRQERVQWASDHRIQPLKEKEHCAFHFTSERLDHSLLATWSHRSLVLTDLSNFTTTWPVHHICDFDETVKSNNRSATSKSKLVLWNLILAQPSHPRCNPRSQTTTPAWNYPNPQPRPRSKRPTAG